LPDDRIALLEYVAAPGAPLTLFVIQRNRIGALVLPVDSLAENVGRFRALTESGGDASRVARALGAALIEPALSLIDSRVTRLVIVPDGPLHRLPFDALRLADGKYLLERYSTGFAPSASVLAGLWARRPTAQEPTSVRMLALGDPAISTTARGNARAPARLFSHRSRSGRGTAASQGRRA
jgi:hypothetical protein